ncbi:MAG: NAD-dependent succinate-semialdehyde dehydrogenase, partial [Microbacteriaceae bacterium]
MNTISTEYRNNLEYAENLLKDFETRLYLNGVWVDASDKSTFEVLNPATNEKILDVASASVSDALSALDAATAASEAWGASSPRLRADLLRACFDEVTRRKDDFATLITLELGKPLDESYAEVKYGAEYLRWFSEEATRMDGRFSTNPEGTGRIVVSYRPVGPAYLITPWNFPLAMVTRKVAPALAAGNTIIVKPASQTPLTTLLFIKILTDIGVPAGVVNVIPSDHSAAISDALLDDTRLRKLSFTGSTEVGTQLMAKAAKNVIRTSMELGGNAPFLVFEDADLDAAVDGALAAKFRNIGQACTAGNRFYVHSSVKAAFEEKLTQKFAELNVADGLDPASKIGPVINSKARAEMIGLVKDTVAEGARLVLGGEALDTPGNFLSPTLMTDVPVDAKITQTEIFGPILSVSTFETEEEAIALANNTRFGLASYVYTKDVQRVNRLIDRIEAGMMSVNSGVLSNAAA